MLFIIENNRYGMGTAVNRSAAGKDLYERATVFGIEGEKINGMDFFEVSQAAIRAREHIYENSSPYVIEMDTYRYRGHSMSDPAKYRTRSEVDTVRQQKDCIENLKEVLQEQKVTDQELKNIDGEIKLLVTNASDFALESKLPDDNELLTDIYL